MKWSKDANLFFIKKMKKIVAYQIDTELFFKDLLMKKKEQIGLFYISLWYNLNLPLHYG
ncbi:MAG: hypothetical protein IPN93_14110 [Bacteroidetes bacterium]|nr:hypothetical protein [Bacteroidota bacterium]